MSETPVAPVAAPPAKPGLEAYAAEIRLPGLTVGIDNIHYDVFLSPRFVELSRKYILELVRQPVSVTLPFGKSGDPKPPGAPEHGAFRRLLTDVLQVSLTRAKFEQSIETDVLHHLALLKYLLAEVSNQFSSILVECKEWIRSRGERFEHSEQAHVLRSKISDVQAGRKAIFREAGATLHRIWTEVEENSIARSRRALFGDAFQHTYDLLQNPLLFVENGSDDHLFLNHYVLLGNFLTDPDRFDVFDSALRDFLRRFVMPGDDTEELAKTRKTSERLMEQARALRSELARLEEEEQELGNRGGADDLFSWRFKRKPGGPTEPPEDVRRKAALLERNLEELAPQIEAAKQRLAFLIEEQTNRIGTYLNEPANARRLLDARANVHGAAPPDSRARLLQEWVHWLEERDLLYHVLAGYEVRTIQSVYCPPIHLQQMKKALVSRDEAKRVEHILEQFPARKISMKKLDEASRAIRRCGESETLDAALRFAEDFMRLRRDRRNYQQVATWMERVSLVRSEQAREVSRANKSLYEFLHPEESRPADDPVLNHTVIKADVRGSTGLTKELLGRGLNPASHFSMNLHEPVKKLLERYGAAKVFIEGDAIILAIYETESTRATQRAVARACVLAREMLAVTQAYNGRAKSSGLPSFEIGLGLAFQDSAPSVWMDGDFRIMISRALNLSDRLSSCSKMARRLFADNPSPFNVFLLQSLMDDAASDEGEELLVRYNMNGIEMNEEAFQKLSTEIALVPMAGNFPLPWGKERVQMFFGEIPLGESLEPVIVRQGNVRQLLPGGKIGEKSGRAFYEVCTDAKLLELARKKLSSR